MISIDCEVFVSTPEYEMRDVKAGELMRKDGKSKFVAMTRFGDRHHGFTPITSIKTKMIDNDIAYKVSFVNNKGIVREMIVSSTQNFFTRMKGLVSVGKISTSDVLIDIEGYMNKLFKREKVESNDYCFCEISIENNNSLYVNGILAGCVYDAVKTNWRRDR